jgi:hypothetical protein
MSRSAFDGVADLRLAATYREPGNLNLIQIHKLLLNVVLLDQLPDHNAQKPAILPVA